MKKFSYNLPAETCKENSAYTKFFREFSLYFPNNKCPNLDISCEGDTLIYSLSFLNSCLEMYGCLGNLETDVEILFGDAIELLSSMTKTIYLGMKVKEQLVDTANTEVGLSNSKDEVLAEEGLQNGKDTDQVCNDLHYDIDFDPLSDDGKEPIKDVATDIDYTADINRNLDPVVCNEQIEINNADGTLIPSNKHVKGESDIPIDITPLDYNEVIKNELSDLRKLTQNLNEQLNSYFQKDVFAKEKGKNDQQSNDIQVQDNSLKRPLSYINEMKNKVLKASSRINDIFSGNEKRIKQKDNGTSSPLNSPNDQQLSLRQNPNERFPFGIKDLAENITNSEFKPQTNDGRSHGLAILGGNFAAYIKDLNNLNTCGEKCFKLLVDRVCKRKNLMNPEYVFEKNNGVYICKAIFMGQTFESKYFFEIGPAREDVCSLIFNYLKTFFYDINKIAYGNDDVVKSRNGVLTNERRANLNKETSQNRKNIKQSRERRRPIVRIDEPMEIYDECENNEGRRTSVNEKLKKAPVNSFNATNYVETRARNSNSNRKRSNRETSSFNYIEQPPIKKKRKDLNKLASANTIPTKKDLIMKSRRNQLSNPRLETNNDYYQSTKSSCVENNDSLSYKNVNKDTTTGWDFEEDNSECFEKEKYSKFKDSNINEVNEGGQIESEVYVPKRRPTRKNNQRNSYLRRSEVRDPDKDVYDEINDVIFDGRNPSFSKNDRKTFSGTDFSSNNPVDRCNLYESPSNDIDEKNDVRSQSSKQLKNKPLNHDIYYGHDTYERTKDPRALFDMHINLDSRNDGDDVHTINKSLNNMSKDKISIRRNENQYTGRRNGNNRQQPPLNKPSGDFNENQYNVNSNEDNNKKDGAYRIGNKSKNAEETYSKQEFDNCKNTFEAERKIRNNSATKKRAPSRDKKKHEDNYANIKKNRFEEKSKSNSPKASSQRNDFYNVFDFFKM